MKTSGWVGIFISASLCLVAPGVRAETSPYPYPPAYAPPYWYSPPGWPTPFPVQFMGDTPDRRFTVSVDGAARPFAYCTGGCATLLYAGKYCVSVRNSADTVAGQRTIRVKEPAVVHVRARSRDSSGPSALVPVGLGLTLGGLAIFGLAANDQHADDTGGNVMVALGVTITGVVLLIVGGAQGEHTEPEVKVVTGH
jgi:hypothetical protein